MPFPISYWNKRAFPFKNPFIFSVIKRYVSDLRRLKKKNANRLKLSFHWWITFNLIIRSEEQVFSSVNYNNVYGRWITTQYLRQIKENSKLNNGGFNKWLEILAGKDLQTKLRKSENVDFKFSASINGTAKASTVN